MALLEKSLLGVAMGESCFSSGKAIALQNKYNDSGVITMQIWTMINPSVILCASLLTFFPTLFPCLAAGA